MPTMRQSYNGYYPSFPSSRRGFDSPLPLARRRKIVKNFLRIIIVIVASLLLIGLVVCAIMITTSYKPESVEQARYTVVEGETISSGDYIDIVSWNIGYAGLDETRTSFKDKGKGVEIIKEEEVRKNLLGITETLSYYNADVYMIQEADTRAKRSFGINEPEEIKDAVNINYAFAYDQKTPLVPYPWPVQGRIESGNAIYTPYTISSAHRVSLPETDRRFPIKYVAPKRAMLVVRAPIEDSSRSVVFISVNLDRENKRENNDQIRALTDFAKAEYEKGNYVIIGGTLNRAFRGTKKNITNTTLWEPRTLMDNLSGDWKYEADDSVPSVRTLNDSYSDNSDNVNTYTVDGFICSPNVKIQMMETVNEEFFYSNHNPVHLVVKIER